MKKAELEKVDIKAFNWYMDSQKIHIENELIIDDKNIYLKDRLDKVKYCLLELDLFINKK